MATSGTPSELHAPNAERNGGASPLSSLPTSRPSNIPEIPLNQRVNSSMGSLPSLESGFGPTAAFGTPYPNVVDNLPQTEEKDLNANGPSNDHGTGHSLPPHTQRLPSRFPSPTLPPPLPDPYLMKDQYYSDHKFSAFLHSLSHYTDLFLRQLYFNLHLRLPSHYFSRVAMIFQNAELTRKEVTEMIQNARRGRLYGVGDWDGHGPRTLGGGYITLDGMVRSPNAYEKIEKSWNTLIESLLREWETLNVVSVLLLSAILAILQIDASSTYVVTRYTAFASLVCALMSLLYGCLFIARFASMKDTTRSVRWASEWAEESSRPSSILWNVWVMLALPSTFLCWAIAAFVACIISYMWHSALQVPDSTTSTSSSSSLSSSSSNTPAAPAIPLKTGRALCTLVTVILFIGLVYLALIIITFKKWGTRVKVWTDDYNDAIDHDLGIRRPISTGLIIPPVPLGPGPVPPFTSASASVSMMSLPNVYDHTGREDGEAEVLGAGNGRQSGARTREFAHMVETFGERENQKREHQQVLERDPEQSRSTDEPPIVLTHSTVDMSTEP